MADMGFLPAVRRLVERTSASRQVLLFSATLDGPVDKLVRDYQHDPVRHDVVPARTSQGVVDHHFWRVDPVTAWRWPPRRSPRTDRRSCSVVPSAARTGSRTASLGRVYGPRPFTATAVRANEREPWPISGPVGSRCWSPPTSRRAASMSMPSPSSSTSIRRPTRPTTCTAPAAPAGPVPTGSSSPWSGRTRSLGSSSSSGSLECQVLSPCRTWASLATGSQMVGPAGDGARDDRARGGRTEGQKARGDGATAGRRQPGPVARRPDRGARPATGRAGRRSPDRSVLRPASGDTGCLVTLGGW